MNPYDRAAVSAVWQRVTQSKQDDCLEDELSEAIADEQRACKTYLEMTKHSANAMFRQIAAQEACHAKKLSSLYYLLFGCPPCRQQYQVHICNLCQAVRDAFAAELKDAKKYEELASRYPEHAALFCTIAKTERHHACMLRSFTEELLCK